MLRPRTARAATLAAAVSLSLALTGCGGGGTTQAGADGGAMTGELVVWHYYDEGSGGLQPFVKTWEERFEKANPEVDVKFEYVPYDQMASKVISAAAAGKTADVIMTAAPWVPEMVKAGAVQQIGDKWDAFPEKGLFPEKVEEGGILQGKRYAVQSFANIEGVYYNKTILDKIGASVPTNLDELEAAMAKAAAAGYTPFTTAAPTGAGGEFSAVPWLVSAGWSYTDADAASGKQTLERIQTWRDRKWLSPNDASGFNAGKNFTTGRYAFAQEGNWMLGAFKKDLKFEWGVAPLAGHDKALIGGESLTIGGKTEKPALAWKFIQDTFLSAQGGIDAAEAGSVPLRSDVASQDVVTKDVNLTAFTKIAAASIAAPTVPNTGKVSDVIGGAWNELIAGRIDADAAADRIAKQVPPLLAD
ncbi:extracellular solute-binding protein [Micromonospora sp. RP3T]|uniref:sugar ABC transporter substrate-binding protein n=1 Tax=Micromonospora sp. RP3T TaxID=2135446 RepID=UPI0011B22C37|nr:extracellular solute-binding protein [Micromonospora sp. RP3T]